ncbi:xanthine dehydrogenase family protein molybdopterin-binding subunit [Poseidonocella sedimentorum]|uniref:Carbon-monoxide dehydrogenase large subunit n=1 Tax=Poseidonocella sedimentorum TaxID=871652 RepID=A0A1I6DI75_9RHOB|nr:xanthine dehydrogenase family protein molybdopterin-binding subunit [Poseidonocella sedimentorum]SFR05042.1 carbon-monoxide dehydrogenase large subunit [Poseidonocella sedimentorum]
MERFGKSQPVRRVEDQRFLRGAGRYIDDIAPQNAAFGHVLRASVAHGRITELDASAAREAPGVLAVLTAADLAAEGITRGMGATVVEAPDGRKGAAVRRPLLAEDRVRFVGEPVAFILAESRAAAADAAEFITLEIDALPAHMALAPGGEALHPEAPENRAFSWAMGDADKVRAAFETAAHVVELAAEDNRVIVNTMEPRGCLADWSEGRLHVAFGGQGVWDLKHDLAKLLGLKREQVHVTIPDVGGGFGMKAFAYPEYFLCAIAARKIGRPVRWMSERGEAMMSDNAGRDLDHVARLAFDEDLRLTGYHVTTRANMGAYNSEYAQNIQTELFAKVMPGTYRLRNVLLEVEGVFTNTTQVDAYRGAGRPEAIYILERAMDMAARELGVSPWELRRRNFIEKHEFPYRSATGVTYDVGDFHKVLSRAEAEAGVSGFDERLEASRAAGKRRGLGLCYYIESILGEPSERAKVEFDDDRTVKLYVGTQSNGQGHETVYAQFLADQSGIDPGAIRVIQGDSDLIPKGGGTGGSRSVTVQNTATLAVVDEMIPKYAAFFAELEEVPPEDVVFDDLVFRAAGTNRTAGLLELSERAREDGRDDLLTFSKRITLDDRSFPNGAHVAEVEVDPETGEVRLDRYTVVDDFGNLINPLLAEGQVHGGVVQGVGQALMERVVHDEDGQLLTASFMDYALPRASDVPMIGFATEPTPSTYNPMGMKGCGEAGTVGALAAISNAVLDALWDLGVRQADMPFTPERVWKMCRDAAARAS